MMVGVQNGWTRERWDRRQVALVGTVGICTLLAVTESGRAIFAHPRGVQLPHSAVNAASVVAHKFDASCKLSNWVGLGKCKHGMSEPGCAEAYDGWFTAGCLCDYSAYPWGFLPRDITPVGFMWALMKTTSPRTYAQIAADAPCMETLDDCKAPREGDVRLDTYGHGWLFLYYDHAWRMVVGELSNATAHAQCLRLGFGEGTVHDDDVSLPLPPAAAGGAHDALVLVDEPCLPAEPLVHCARRSRAASEVRRLRASRLSCKQVGPAACYVGREGGAFCMVGTSRYSKQTMPPHLPSMACGTAGTNFLDRPPVVPPGEPHDEQTGCLTLFDDALSRCIAQPAADGGSARAGARGLSHEDRKMCSQACHDSIIHAIRRDDCFELGVNSTWGTTYGGALKGHAEQVYSRCGQDLWQSAALSADTYEKCVTMLLDMFRRCQEDSERHLCSDACAEKVDEAMAAENCYSVHYYRNEPRAFRGHVTLLNELRERVCIWLPPEWDSGDEGEEGVTAQWYY
ncbi:hypothetical protein KFE25_001552 [Diacronema lutheri]|uniref:Uncharacterized protein n=1 Tax=Diacronema lutheri TaxID=2081491 RepID=A0A8J5XCK9_DIALT|nr:hypothetical protein KFE25_001552 [Diacronema lutheri]